MVFEISRFPQLGVAWVALIMAGFFRGRSIYKSMGVAKAPWNRPEAGLSIHQRHGGGLCGAPFGCRGPDLAGRTIG